MHRFGSRQIYADHLVVSFSEGQYIPQAEGLPRCCGKRCDTCSDRINQFCFRFARCSDEWKARSWFGRPD
jgi:hypothetical protein